MFSIMYGGNKVIVNTNNLKYQMLDSEDKELEGTWVKPMRSPEILKRSAPEILKGTPVRGWLDPSSPNSE
jgi:hypothetical protein